jgi:hypothetical protein
MFNLELNLDRRQADVEQDAYFIVNGGSVVVVGLRDLRRSPVPLWSMCVENGGTLLRPGITEDRMAWKAAYRIADKIQAIPFADVSDTGNFR